MTAALQLVFLNSGDLFVNLISSPNAKSLLNLMIDP